MANTWIVSVESRYVNVNGRNCMYPALTWTGMWSYIEDRPDNKALFEGEVNDQVLGELTTSPNVTLESAVLKEE